MLILDAYVFSVFYNHMWKSTKEINGNGTLVLRTRRATGAQRMAKCILWPKTGKTPLLTEWRLEVKVDTDEGEGEGRTLAGAQRESLFMYKE